MNHVKSGSMSFLLLLVLYCTVWAQPFPDTLRVAVTYYDFHSDQTCHDFNPVISNDFAIPNMVQTTLDTDGLPVRGSRVFFSYYIENWFRSSLDGEQTVTNKEPVYYIVDGSFLSENTVSGRNPYDNRKIEDSLTFQHVGDGVNYPLGTYQYLNNAFFPLDGIGFGNEPTMNWDGGGPLTDHNYSFTMMLKREFIYKEGMKFSFYGDDDLWVFINDGLALDIGGIHMQVAGNFDLDNLAGQLGLTLGEKYEIAIFYGERQANSSNILITTNIISAFPNELDLIVIPNDTIRAGDTLTVLAQLMSDTGLVTDFPGTISWSFMDSLAFNHDSTFTVSNDQVTFIPTEAHTWVKITGRYDDNTNNIHISSYVWILVIPNVPDHSVIEASPDKPAYGTTPQSPLWDDNPLASVTIDRGQQSNEQFYAMLRDRFGNWIGPAHPVEWTSADDAIVTAEPGSVPENGQGRAVRKTWDCDTSTVVTGTYDYNGKELADDILVYLLGETVVLNEAFYYDNNADGYVDSIHVKATTNIDGGLTDAHVQEMLDNAITLPSFRNFTVNGGGVVSDGFYIDVSEDKSNNPTTYVTADDKLKATEYVFSTGGSVEAITAPIYDKIAPIILWEKKAAFLVDYMIDTISDTLTVQFSEPVRRVTSDEPFYFLDQDNNTNYTVKLSDVGQPDNDKMVFYVTSLSGVDFMEEGDSLWIKETDRIGDTEGNFQNNNNNTRRKLYVKRKVIPYDFNPVAISPIDLANIHINKIPSEIIAVLENQGILDNLNLSQNGNGSYVGMLIMALPDPENIGKFMPDIEVIGHISIFDPVGNQVVSRNRMAWWHETKRLLYVWNVKNNNGRTVGLGSYLAVIEIEDITPSLTDQNRGKKSAKKVLLGVGTRITR